MLPGHDHPLLQPSTFRDPSRGWESLLQACCSAVAPTVSPFPAVFTAGITHRDSSQCHVLR